MGNVTSSDVWRKGKASEEGRTRRRDAYLGESGKEQRDAIKRTVPVSEHARERTLPPEGAVSGQQGAEPPMKYLEAGRKEASQVRKEVIRPGLGVRIVPERSVGGDSERLARGRGSRSLGGVKSTEPRPHGRGTGEE